MNRTCNQCKKEFYLNPRIGLNWAKKTNRGRFCSRKCFHNWRKGMHVSPDTEFKKGQPAANYKNGIWSYRKYRKQECEDCGSEKVLHVHHIDRNRENNNPDNLRTLCKDCHWTYHRGNRVAWNKGLKGLKYGK